MSRRPPPLDPGAIVFDPSSPREVLTADEVAALLGVDRQTVYDYAGRGEIPHRRLGRRILFGRVAILAWLNGDKA